MRASTRFLSLLLLGTAALLPALSFAQIKDVTVIPETRYDRIDEGKDEGGKNLQDRIQGRIRLGFTFDVKGHFELIGLASTGDSFGNDWFNVRDLNTGLNQRATMSFRQLYLKKVFGKNEIDAGTFGGFTTIGSAGISSTSGYIDGVRFQHQTEAGAIHVTVGGINDVNNPDFFTRARRLNYIEVEMDREVAKNLLAHAGYDHFDGDDYLKERIEFTPAFLGEKILHVMADCMYDVQKNAATYEASVGIDLLGALDEGLRNRVVLDVYYSHLDPRLHNRNSLNSAYLQDGDLVTVKVSGQFGPQGKVGWFVRNSTGTRSRLDAGVSLKLSAIHH